MSTTNALGRVAFTLAFLVACAATSAQAQGIGVEDMKAASFRIADLKAERAMSERPYLPFLNTPTLRTGLYELAAGSTDGQEPHDDDEVYYVISGKAKISIGGEPQDVATGDVIFVGAHVEHHFHDITEDLSVLVFFSEAPTP